MAMPVDVLGRVVWMRTSEGSPMAPASSSALAFTMGG